MSPLTGDARTLAATTGSPAEVSARQRILSPCRITRLVGWPLFFFYWIVRTAWHFVVRYYGPSIKREPFVFFILSIFFSKWIFIIFFFFGWTEKSVGWFFLSMAYYCTRTQSNGLQSGFWHLGSLSGRPLIPRESWCSTTSVVDEKMSIKS